MNFKKISILCSLAAACFWGSCDIINPEEQQPTYVRIDSFAFEPGVNTGTSSQRITSVWAYLNGQILGAFDLPATIPVLADEPSELLLRAGVMYGGISDILIPYPFFRGDTMTLTPTPGEIINFTPKTRYFSEDLLNFINEDFELGNSFTLVYGDTTLERTSDPSLVFEGDFSGHIEFNNHKFAEYVMTTSFTSSGSAGTFAEINYRGSLPFDVGITTTNSGGQAVSQYLFTYRAREDWNKVYVGMQDFINAYPNRPYRLLIRVYSAEPTQGYVSLDNIKVVNFR